MENIQFNKPTYFYICESFARELREVTKEYGSIVINPYKAKCKYQDVDDFYEKQNIEEDSYILGGCTLNKNNLKYRASFDKEEKCFNMFAPKAVVDFYIEKGGYVITPGWLSNWKKYVKEIWGFEKVDAQMFFKEFCKTLVLLDTQVDKNSTKHLEEFAIFVDRPFEIMPVGLDFFKLYVDNLIYKSQIKKLRVESTKRVDEAMQVKANYEMAFDMLSRIIEKLDEKDIIQKIKEVFIILFAAEKITYIAIEDSKIVEKHSSTITIDEISSNLLESRELYTLMENGFMLKLMYGNKVVGIVKLENIAFMRYINQYINLAVSISDVCALAVDNSRNYIKTKEVEAQLIEHAKIAAMSEMMGSVAHQWRQPLNELNINIEMLEDYYEIGKIDEDFIEIFIDKNIRIIQFLSKTITSFSDFFRTNKEKVDFGIRDSIEKTLEVIQMQLTKNGVEVEVTGSDSKIYGLPNEFQQVLLNIINNSKDAIIENNNKEGKISIDVMQKEKSVSITITDNGGGLDDDIIGRVFEPYFTTKEQGKGLGMGLYISKVIIEDSLGGLLSVKNCADGAEFKIVLEVDNE